MMALCSQGDGTLPVLDFLWLRFLRGGIGVLAISLEKVVCVILSGVPIGGCSVLMVVQQPVVDS